MDFQDSIEHAAFRKEVQNWLSENYPSDQERQGNNELELSKLWQRRKFDAGWACINWPQEHGGRGASGMEQLIWEQEEAKMSLIRNPFVIGHGMVAPTLIAWADQQKCERYLPKMASGEEIWCQLFSEPSSGSDLAGIRTSAKRDGDDWIVNGQKVWTSFAHYADYAILIARTDTSVVKHAGLTYFFIDMKSAGIERRPIKQISGDTDFNEVFLSDVRVPDSQRLGKVGEGWKVAMTTLMNERITAGESDNESSFAAVFELARKVRLNDKPAIENDSVRSQLANWYCQETGLKFNSYRMMSALSRGEVPGPEGSISKLVSIAKSQDMASFAIDLLEDSGAIYDPSITGVSGEFHKVYLKAPGSRIAGGTDEILLNIIAERVLGMPQDLRVDKGVPFSDIPRS